MFHLSTESYPCSYLVIFPILAMFLPSYVPWPCSPPCPCSYLVMFPVLGHQCQATRTFPTDRRRCHETVAAAAGGYWIFIGCIDLAGVYHTRETSRDYRSADPQEGSEIIVLMTLGTSSMIGLVTGQGAGTEVKIPFPFSIINDLRQGSTNQSRYR